MASSTSCCTVTQESIQEAYLRISSIIHKTPVLTSSNLNTLTGKQIFFKCENLQKTGSFKARGALNYVKCLMDQGNDGVAGITHSSGNHGQALAWAAKQCGLECVVVVPENAPACKLQAIKHYGATIIPCESNMTARENTCEKMSQELKYAVVEPHNDLQVMDGQGTVGLELLEQVDDLDAVIVSVGGGGLVAGVAKCVTSKAPNIKVFCAEPEGKHLQHQLESKQSSTTSHGTLLNTIADGIRVQHVGDKCFPLLLQCCQSLVFTLTDDEIKQATKDYPSNNPIHPLFQMVVEPSAALPLAAVLKYNKQLEGCQRIGLILCGGNLNLDHLF
uniref:Serine racemase n=1 Tax=Ditylenchus dipsaci TaxID=166011 RepID=A0A915DN49_9BILA